MEDKFKLELHNESADYQTNASLEPNLSPSKNSVKDIIKILTVWKTNDHRIRLR